MITEELRALDAEVAEKVMGWRVVSPDGGEDWFERQVLSHPGPVMVRFREGGQYVYRNPDDFKSEHWSPSTGIAAAWEVVRAIDCFGFSITKGEQFHVTFLTGVPDFIPKGADDDVCVAICRAALKAKVATDGR